MKTGKFLKLFIEWLTSIVVAFIVIGFALYMFSETSHGYEHYCDDEYGAGNWELLIVDCERFLFPGLCYKCFEIKDNITIPP